jgi:hypothetical protein
MDPVTLKQRLSDLEPFARELVLLREHNRRLEPSDRSGLLLLAEASVGLLVLDRFLRAVLGAEADEGDELNDLLTKVSRNGAIRLPGNDVSVIVEQVAAISWTLHRGRLAEAAAQAEAADVPTYLSNELAPEVERLFQLIDELFSQIDPDTGRARVTTSAMN